MSNELLIIIISSIIPLCTMIYTIVGMKHKAETDYVERMEKRLNDCESDRDELRKRLDAIELRIDKG